MDVFMLCFLYLCLCGAATQNSCLLSPSALAYLTDWRSKFPTLQHAPRWDVPVFILLHDEHFIPNHAKNLSLLCSRDRIARLRFTQI